MEQKRIKTKIGVGSVVKANVRDIKDKIRKARIRRMRNEVVGRFQAMVWKNRFLAQFVDEQNIDMSYSLIQYLCSKEEVCLEMEEPISNLPKK